MTCIAFCAAGEKDAEDQKELELEKLSDQLAQSAVGSASETSTQGCQMVIARF